ncbi:MAG: glycosyltransferase family 4 protein [Pseudomonadota bacterium]
MNGGIGTANLGLAMALTAAGHQVEILYTRVADGTPFPSSGEFDYQVRRFAQIGLNLSHVDHPAPWNDWLGKSHAVLARLSEAAFDVVFFNDTHGNGFASLLAKRTGSPHLQHTRMVVVAHSASQWIFDLNQQPVAAMADIRLIELERRSLELADAVLSPSEYLLKTYETYGWALPADSYVHPNILPMPNLPARRRSDLNGPPDELVFFGRLETRKGLWLFCNALDRLRDRLAGRTVTFLGKSVPIDGRSSAERLIERAKAWPFEIRLLTDQDSASALAYLARRPCVAILPSVAENSPCAVSECLAAGIPFIATVGSGTQELISKRDRSRCLVEPAVDPLVDKLKSVLDKGQKPAKPAHESQQTEKHLLAWLGNRSAQRRSKAQAGKPTTKALPSCLMVVAAVNRPNALDPNLPPLPKGSRICLLGTQGAANPQISALRQDEFSIQIRKMARDIKGPIIISDGTFPDLQPAIQRALTCFDQAPDIMAVSGLARDSGNGNNLAFGPAAGLMSIAKDSNQGFAIVRPQVADTVAQVTPFDRMNGRILPAQSWIHRLFAKLMAEGQRCELLPDLRLERCLDSASRPFEGFDPLLEHRSAESHSPIRVMAAARALRQERRASVVPCLSDLQRPGDPALTWTGPIDGPATAMAMARLARRAGHPEVAGDFVAGVLARSDLDRGIATHPNLDRPAGQVLRRQAHIISLFDLALQGRVNKHNLDHPWSFKLLTPKREIEMHPNPISEGRALLRFNDLDLTRITQGQTTIQLPQRSGNQVVCRMEIASVDTADRFVEEITISPSGRGTLRFNLPDGVRRRCQLSLSVFMAYDADKTEDSWVRWSDPILMPDETSGREV